MRAIILVALSLLVAYSVAQNTAVCKSWKRQPKGARCKNGLYKSTCAQDHASACQGKKKNTGKQSDGGNKGGQGGGGGGGASAGEVAKGCKTTDSPACKVWLKRDDDFCGNSKKQMRQKSCCSLSKKECNGKKKDKKPKPKKKKTTKATRTTSTTTTTTTTTPLSVEASLKECCTANGVPDYCLKICTLNPTGAELCKREENCESYFRQANYCANNANDLTECCKAKGVQALCYKFCDGTGKLINVADINQLAVHRPCLENGQAPRDCGEEDYEANGKQWKSDGADFGGQGKFPALVKNIVSTLPVCTAKG